MKASHNKLQNFGILLHAFTILILIPAEIFSYMIPEDFSTHSFSIFVITWAIFFVMRISIVRILWAFEADLHLVSQIHKDGSVEVLGVDRNGNEVYRYKCN